ncbi:hypothetical protein J2Z69_000933 [Paenibacillus shirakamiensis]|uniref:Uncharacterized protein n=1 Tax=Paenibacillus shirakamiensis TaxID=1265935 RepID=A0ABS4JDW3_9BACL|nr:hypothetical protein [Paenibacillus shirakamiensis]MBP1999914.1 hypothetical protein [Paenibacillus shirakamiensis]
MDSIQNTESTPTKILLVSKGTIRTILLSLFTIDIAAYVLARLGYNFIVLDISWLMIPIFLHAVFALYLAILKRNDIEISKLSRITVAIGIIFVVWHICLSSLFSTYTYNYIELESPEHSESLILKYNCVTLGETTYHFQIYQKTDVPGLTHKIGAFSTSSREYSTLKEGEKAIRIGHEQWLSEKVVVLSNSTWHETITLE